MIKTKKYLEQYKKDQIAAIKSIDTSEVEKVIDLLYHCKSLGNRIFIVGNGGSAANASHFSVDLGKSANDNISKTAPEDNHFKVLSLTDNVPFITAISNDYSYEDIFSKQLEMLVEPDDVVIAVSVSGNSPNCVNALSLANARYAYSVAIVSDKNDGGEMSRLASHEIRVDGNGHYGKIEDAQMTVLHMLCYNFIENYG